MPLPFILIGLLVAGLVLLLLQYNRLLRCKKKVEERWSNIELNLNQRYEVLPEMLELVQGYAKHETAVFETIASARNKTILAANVIEQAAAESLLSQSLTSLFAVSEAYPALKKEEVFRDLQQHLSDAEDAIHLAKKEYNKIVKQNNQRVMGFPGKMIAGILGFGVFDLFEA